MNKAAESSSGGAGRPGAANTNGGAHTRKRGRANETPVGNGAGADVEVKNADEKVAGGLWMDAPPVEELQLVDKETFFTVGCIYLCWWADEKRWYAVRVCDIDEDPALRRLMDKRFTEAMMHNNNLYSMAWYCVCDHAPK